MPWRSPVLCAERLIEAYLTETARPLDQTMERQQKRFDEFRHVYNNERSHETLGQKRPATLYRPSLRPYPESLPPIDYAGHLETRNVGHNGMMRWKNGVIFTSKTLRGEWVGLERSMTASGRSTTDLCCWRDSLSGRCVSTADRHIAAGPERRELFIRAIGLPVHRGDGVPSCDLNGG